MAKAKKKTPAKKPAAKAKSAPKVKKPAGEPKVHAAIARQLGESITVSHGDLTPSPLNPRKHFNETKLREMADSIYAKGLLQPLLVRKIKGDRMELVIGESRWRAIGILLKDKRIEKDFTIPATLMELNDTEVVEIALIENTQRQNLTPLEEARAYADLRARKVTTEDIAAHTGAAKRTVQSRLTMIDRCAPQVLDALDAGTINMTTARSLAMASHIKQREMLVDITEGAYATEEEILRAVTGDMPGTHLAIFPLDRYKGDIVTEEGTDRSYFADEALFLELQEAAVEEKVADIKAKGGNVLVLRADKNQYFSNFKWKKKPKHKDATTIIEVGRGEVTIHTGMVATEADSDQDQGDDQAGEGTSQRAPGDDAEEEDATGTAAFTKAHRAHANRRKTYVLQDAVASNPFTAMRLVCARLLDNYAFSMIRLGREPNPASNREPLAMSPKLRVALQQRTASLPAEVQGQFDVDQDVGMGDGNGADIWAALSAMSDGEVAGLFSALIAAQVGIWGDTLGCDEVEIVIADALGVCGNEASHGLTLQAEDLEGLRKPALLGARFAVGAEDAAGAKAGELKDRLVGNIQAGDTGLVLPTLAFLTPEDTGAEIARLLALPKQAKAA